MKYHGYNRNNKIVIAVVIFFSAFLGRRVTASEGPKKYAFALVQQATEDYNRKIESLKKAHELEIGILQTKVTLIEAELESINCDTPQKLIDIDAELDELKKLLGEKLSLTKNDLYKLKYLLGHVVAT